VVIIPVTVPKSPNKGLIEAKTFKVDSPFSNLGISKVINSDKYSSI